MIRKSLAVIAAVLLSSVLAGQDTDYGIWYEVKADKDIWKGLRFDLEASVRTDQNAARIETIYLEPGLRYKFNDFLSAGIYYRLIEQLEKDDQFYIRHRWFAQVKGTAPSFYRFTLAVRYRIQEQFKTYIEDPEDELPVWYHRVRFELGYDIMGIPLMPYFNTELHGLLSEANEYTVDKWRSMIGIEYTLNKRHTFGIEYIYNESRVTKPAYMNLVGLTYSVSL